MKTSSSTGAVAESGLPEGGPAGKGLPLDSGIPGSKTFVKPEDAAVREFDKAKNKSMYRVDEADSLLGDPDRIEVNEDNADKHDGIGGWGKGEWDQRSPKTKWPYRDNTPSTKSASAEFVVNLWELLQAPTLHLLGGSTSKIALRMDPILDGLNSKFIERAAKCTVSTQRVDAKNLRWIFSVDCGNGPKAVKIKAFRKGKTTKLSKMDLDIKCSCPAWRWLGPEYHAKTEEYIDGAPRGTASFPIIRDPTGINKVCKHVAAVIFHVKSWEIPIKK